MKIALTGSSSTGKTTQAKRLMEIPSFADVVGEFVTEDARSLLRSLGHTSMDAMSRTDLRRFQELYLEQKSNNERSRERFLADRSYVDVAAYWLVRDSFDLPLSKQQSFERRCRELARGYDLHIHFPFGQIPFASDGYRSEDLDFHRRIGAKILELLRDWDVKFVSIESSDLESRLRQILLAVSQLSTDGAKTN
jgi:nicotinamide riboside kinase